jgi:hypothetical protein
MIHSELGAVCGIDGGKPPKTVFAFQSESDFGTRHGRWNTWRRPPVSHFDLIAAEKPEGVIREYRTPASVISPAGWGMAGLFSVPITPDGMRVWIPTKAWKSKLFGGAFWNAKKEVFCGNIVQAFSLKGLDPRDENDQDVIDAIGIAEAASLFTRKELKRWAVMW